MLGLVVDNAETIGEVLGEVTAAEIRDETTIDGLHRCKDALEGLDGTEFRRKGGCIVALVIVENSRDATFTHRQDPEQLLELKVHRD